MLRLLIAESSVLFAGLLQARLLSDMQVEVCHDGEEALRLLQSFQPDAMILNLQLPRKDGFTLLRQSSYVPRVILGVAGFISSSVQQTAYSLGVSQLVLMPSVNATITSLASLLQQANAPDRKPDLREQARYHLQQLNIQPHLDGYKDLAVALPLFFADPEQTLSKELYPTVAEIMGHDDARLIERSIRSAITRAWKTRDKIVWQKYFPGERDCPSNKLFLARICEMMK